MTTTELSLYKLPRATFPKSEHPRRFYFENNSHGLLPRTPYNHRKIFWIGLYFWEFRICIFRAPN